MRFTIIILFSIYLTACETEPSLKIATSSNMQFAMEELVETFEQESKIKVELIISSSGKLTSQIEFGAPFDVFVAANIKYPQYLYEKGLTKQPPEIYAYGQLVLWTLKDFEPSMKSLTSQYINKIAIANPKTAPYGQASIDVLNKNLIYKEVEGKLIYGESVSQCNQFITTQSAEIGFTSMSTVLSKKMNKTGQWIKINTNDYTPIAQSVVVLKKSEQQNKALLFYTFLMSETAQNILLKYGYLTKADI